MPSPAQLRETWPTRRAAAGALTLEQRGEFAPSHPSLSRDAAKGSLCDLAVHWHDRCVRRTPHLNVAALLSRALETNAFERTHDIRPRYVAHPGLRGGLNVDRSRSFGVALEPKFERLAQVVERLDLGEPLASQVELAALSYEQTALAGHDGRERPFHAPNSARAWYHVQGKNPV